MTNYGLKIKTKFTEEEIVKNTKVINLDEAKHFEFKENNLENIEKDFISHTIININAEGASVEFVGRYKTKDSLCDVSCIVNHNASHTKSKINVRGIADVNGKIISRSNILVTENIKRVVGEEKVKFIFVTDENGQTGEIDTIPNLDIASHEVVVSHAMSVSKIKKADIWYAGLHGASEKEAEKSFEESFLN
jgi:Fe-S cluster assembly scaffold protein SufB